MLKKNFLEFIITEKLHIHEDMDNLSDYIYYKLRDSISGRYVIDTNIPEKLKITKVVIEIDNNMTESGSFNAGKSKKYSDGNWIIYIKLKTGFYLDTVKHEMNHALRYTKNDKSVLIKKLNYIKSKILFKSLRDSDIETFFYYIYISSDDEITSLINDVHGLIKEYMNNIGIYKLRKDQFLYIVETSQVFEICSSLIDFRISNLFKEYSKNNLNKFFYLYEENKEKMDNISDSKFSFFKKIKYIFDYIKNIFSNNINFDIEDNIVYKPIKNGKYYEKWINSQGEKLKLKIYKLYDHYQ